MSVMVVRLRVGDEVIAEVSEDLQGNYILKKPVLMAAAATENGGMRIDMVPFQPFADQEYMKKGLTIEKKDVLFAIPASQSISRGYTEKMSDVKIVTPGELNNLKQAAGSTLRLSGE